MALSAVELYERLKPPLGEDETKALIEYVDGKVRGEVATKEDMLLLKADLGGTSRGTGQPGSEDAGGSGGYIA